jgi:hypothetical protein
VRVGLFDVRLAGCRDDAADVNEPAIFTPRVVEVDAPERAVVGTFPADVFDIFAPVDPEGTTNFTYSVFAGDVNNVFGIGGPQRDHLVVARSPGPLFVHSPYNLSIGATDFGVPPAMGVLIVVVNVQRTRILQPVNGTVCFHENPCPVSYLPAHRAVSSGLSVGGWG